MNYEWFYFSLLQKMAIVKIRQLFVSIALVTLLITTICLHGNEAALAPRVNDNTCTNDCWSRYSKCLTEASTEMSHLACIQSRYICVQRC